MGQDTSDLIDDFLALTEGIPSPPQFRLWSGISTLAGALERRCWVETARSVLYPNMFVLLVGPPASGKTQAIDYAESLWIAAKKFKLAPNNMTGAALVDALKTAGRVLQLPKDAPQPIFEYHTLLVPCSEFGVLVPMHDISFLSVLNYIYDNPIAYREQRRHFNSGKETEIIHPQLGILAGSQPGFLASLLPEEAWAMGFTSRIIMIYGSQAPKVSLFSEQEPRHKEHAALAKRLNEIASLYGRFRWEPEAAHYIENWAAEGLPPVPEHSKLAHYNGRRALHTIKLSMIAAIARSPELVIRLEDVRRAQDWLLGAEQLMPDVFREMVAKSDNQVIQELHFMMWNHYIKHAKRPIHEAQLISFLSQRVPSEKVMRVLEVAERSNVIAREAGGKLYVPRPRADHGME